MKNPRATVIAIIVGIAVLFAFALSVSTFITIEPGEKGILFRKFGGGLEMDRVYSQGFHVVAPWNTMYIYDVKIQEQEETMEALARNGLSIELDVSFRYRPQAEALPTLHNEVGKTYASKIVIPEIRASTREVIGRYTPEELYSTRRDSIQRAIFTATDSVLKKKNLLLDALLIRNIKLPKNIAAAIERKLRQEQESQEYDFRIEKERKEAERKRIEAKGVRDFQAIISRGLTDRLLRWKGIEATENLAKSENTKIVIMGNDDESLPVILGQGK